MDPLTVPCPRCEAPVGAPCVTIEGEVRGKPHRRRRLGAAESPAESNSTPQP